VFGSPSVGDDSFGFGGLTEGLVRQCESPGCKKRPHYNMPGMRALWCSEHKGAGMVNVTGVKCEVDTCLKRASYGFDRDKRLRCAEHKQPGMLDVAHRCVLTWGGLSLLQPSHAELPTGGSRGFLSDDSH
jgi:hypothetical protein